MRLEGITGVVTGAASGLGEATARMLAEAGAKPVLLDLDGDGARRVAEEIGGSAKALNVADGAAAEAVMAEIVAESGRASPLGQLCRDRSGEAHRRS